MPAYPVPPHDKWTTRPEEVEGFISYIQDLASWAGLGDNEWPREILWSLRSPTVITWNQMTAAQITRSTRLLSILKQCFSGHARANLILGNYESSQNRVNCCGFEGVRLLSREFGIKTRTELLFFRNRITSGVFKCATIPETVRQIQHELFKFARIQQLVDPSVNNAQLDIMEPDQILILLRSLPDACRQWLVLNVVQESFQAYTEAALRYESQQRAWSELNHKPIAQWKDKGKGKGGKGSEDEKNQGKGKGEDKQQDSPHKDTQGCFKCGSTKHFARDCPHKYDQYYQYKDKKGSGKSPEKGKTNSKSSKGKETKGKDSKGKGKGKSKSKKGQRAAEFSESSDYWSDYDEGWDESWKDDDQWSEISDGGRLASFVGVVTYHEQNAGHKPCSLGTSQTQKCERVDADRVNGKSLVRWLTCALVFAVLNMTCLVLSFYIHQPPIHRSKDCNFEHTVCFVSSEGSLQCTGVETSDCYLTLREFMEGYHPTDPGQAMEPEPFVQFEANRTPRRDAASLSPIQVADQPSDNSQQITRIRAGQAPTAEPTDPSRSKQLVGQGACLVSRRKPKTDMNMSYSARNVGHNSFGAEYHEFENEAIEPEELVFKSMQTILNEQKQSQSRWSAACETVGRRASHVSNISPAMTWLMQWFDECINFDLVESKRQLSDRCRKPSSLEESCSYANSCRMDTKRWCRVQDGTYSKQHRTYTCLSTQSSTSMCTGVPCVTCPKNKRSKCRSWTRSKVRSMQVDEERERVQMLFMPRYSIHPPAARSQEIWNCGSVVRSRPTSCRALVCKSLLPCQWHELEWTDHPVCITRSTDPFTRRPTPETRGRSGMQRVGSHQATQLALSVCNLPRSLDVKLHPCLMYSSVYAEECCRESVQHKYSARAELDGISICKGQRTKGRAVAFELFWQCFRCCTADDFWFNTQSQAKVSHLENVDGVRCQQKIEPEHRGIMWETPNTSHEKTSHPNMHVVRGRHIKPEISRFGEKTACRIQNEEVGNLQMHDNCMGRNPFTEGSGIVVGVVHQGSSERVSESLIINRCLLIQSLERVTRRCIRAGKFGSKFRSQETIMDLCMQFALCLEMCQPQDASMFDYRYVRRRLNCLCIHEQRWVEAFVAAQKMLMQDVLGSHLIGCVVKRSGFEILKCHKSWYSYAFFASGKTINMTPEVCPDSPYYWEDLGHVVRAWTLRPAQGRQNGREEIDQLVACLFVERHVRLIWHDGSVISKRELSVVMSSRSVKKVLTGCSGLKVQKQVISRCRACNMQRSRLFDREMIACKQWCGQFDIDEKAIGSCREMSRLVGNEGQPKYSRLVGNIGQPKHRQVALSLQVECTVCVNLEDVEVQVQDRSASCGCLLCRMRCDVIQGIVIGRHKQMCCCAFPEREYHRYAHEKTMLLPLGGVTTRWLLHMQTKLHRCVELPLGGVTMRWLLRAVFEPGVQETLMSCDEMCRPHRMRVVLARQVDSCEDVVKFERNRMVEPRYGHVEKATWQSMLSGWDVKGVVSVIHLGYGTHVISGIFTEYPDGFWKCDDEVDSCW